MARLKKFFIVSTMFITVLAMTVTIAPQASAAASAGDLIKMNGLSSIYYLGSDGKRYVFPNETTYFSWYSDFSSVKVITQAELEALPLGANVTVRPGTKLVKITTNPKVYAVTANGTLVAIPDEATAKALYGDNWAKRVVDVPDAFFTNYKTSSATVSATAYPQGSLVKFGTGADIYYINAEGKAQKIANEAAFLANRFKFTDVITSTLALPATGADITGAESALTDTASGAGGTPISGGSGLTVALAGDTLTSTNIPSYASLVPFATYNLTASNDGSVIVTDMTFTRFGTGATSDFEGGFLFQGDTRLTTIRSVDSSNNTISFSGLGITVPAGQTLPVTLKMNAKTTATVGGSHAFKIASASNISASGATVSGSFPVAGNMMSFSSSASAATLTLTSSAIAATKKVGETQITLGEYTINNATANEDVNIYRIKLKNDGTASNGAVKNFSLDLDGTKVVENVQMVDKYVDFILPTPFLLKKSKQITATVRGDVTTDIGKTVILYLNNKADMDARGSAYGNFYSAGITNTSWLSTTVQTTTINGSAINVSLDGPSASDVKKNTSNVTFAKLLVKSENEDVNIENLRMTIDMLNLGSAVALNNVKMVDSANNASYTVTDPAGTASEAVDFENIYLKKGVQYTFEVKGDIPDEATSTQTYKVSFNFACPTPTKGRYTTSDAAIATTDFSATTLAGQVMTVALPSAALNVVATNNATYTKGATKVLLYKGKLTASAVDNLKVSKLPFTASSSSSVSGGFDRLYLYKLASDGTETLLDDEASLANASTTDVVFSGFTFDIPKGISGTQYFVVRGDVKSNPTAGLFQVKIKNSTATGTDYTIRDTDNNALTDAYISGNVSYSHYTTIAAKGTLTIDFDINETGINIDKNVLAGSTFLVGRLKLTAAKEDAKIVDLSLDNTGDASDSDVGTLYLYKDKEMTQLVGGTAQGNLGYAKFENLNFVVPTTGTTYLYLAAQTKATDYSASPASGSTGTQGRTVKFTTFNAGTVYITKVRGVSTGEDYAAGTDLTLPGTASKQGTLLSSMISNVATSMGATGVLSGGSNKTVFSFKVTAASPSSNVDYDSAAAGLKLATTTLTISTSSGVVLTGFQIRRVGGSGAVAASVATTSSGVQIGFADSYGANTDLIVRPGETAEYEILAYVSVTGTSQSCQVSINNMSDLKYYYNTTNSTTESAEFYPIITGLSYITGATLTN